MRSIAGSPVSVRCRRGERMNDRLSRLEAQIDALTREVAGLHERVRMLEGRRAAGRRGRRPRRSRSPPRRRRDARAVTGIRHHCRRLADRPHARRARRRLPAARAHRLGDDRAGRGRRTRHGLRAHLDRDGRPRRHRRPPAERRVPRRRVRPDRPPTAVRGHRPLPLPEPRREQRGTGHLRGRLARRGGPRPDPLARVDHDARRAGDGRAVSWCSPATSRPTRSTWCCWASPRCGTATSSTGSRCAGRSRSSSI